MFRQFYLCIDRLLRILMKSSYLIYTLLFIFTCECFSQEKQDHKSIFDRSLQFHLIDDSSGMSNNFVNDILQDSLGYIWVSTFDGLNRYDGTEFKKFKNHFSSEHHGLSNNFVKELKLLNQSELLIATDNGLNIFNFKKETFRVVNSQDGLILNNVSAIDIDSDSNVIIATYQGGIQIADSNRFFEELPNLENLSSKEVSSMTIQNDSILWVGTFKDGLNKINLITKKVTALTHGSHTHFPSGIINKLYTDSQNNLWIGSREGLQLITNKGDTLNLNKSHSPISGLSDNDIISLKDDQKGNLWIGTRNGGLNILEISSLVEQSKNLKIKWFLPKTDGSSVYNRTVSAIMKDREDNMWLGTPTGINYVNPNGETVTLIQRDQAKKNSISHNRIGAIITTKNNNIWIGTDGNGLDLYDPKKGVIKSFKHRANDRNSLNNNYILSLLEDSEGNLWVGTYRGGIHKITADHKQIKHYLESSVENGSDVRTIFETNDKNIWVGTNRGGLYNYNRKDDNFSYIEHLGKIDIRAIDEDKNGVLWLATYGSGIIKYNPRDQSTRVFNSINTPALTTDVIFSILVLNENDILCGTRYGGLIRMNNQGSKVKQFLNSDGLSNNTICSMIKQNNTYVWMGTYHGISRYNLQTNEIIDLSSLNNIQNGEFNVGAVAIRDSTTLYFGGNNGMNIVNTLDFDHPKQQPNLVINQLSVLNQTERVSDQKGAILNQAIAFKDNIILKHYQSSFSVGFTALKYPDSRKVSYTYKLENHNNYWVDTKGIGLANFTNVPPGEYNLKVKMNSGFENPVFKNLQITILSPFWKTTWAYLLYLVVGSLLIWVVLKYYTERVRLKNSLIFEKKQRQLEHELNEERLRFFTAFSHELKTALTLVIAPIENLIVKEKRSDLKEKLFFVRKNGKKLSKSINQLLEFRKSEKGLSTLNIGKHPLPKKLKKWIESYHALAIWKNIELSYHIEKENSYFLVDLEKIEIIINNLISNAINYCKKGGKVHVEFSANEDSFKIEVTDTGIGIEKKEFENIFNWYYRSNSTLKKSGTGIGLALSKRFAELHKGNILLQSTPGKKTVFSLIIPLIKEDDKQLHVNLNHSREPNFLDDIEISSIPTKSSDFTEGIVSKNKPLLLIVDDNPDILIFLKEICIEEFKVILAADGVEGVKKAQRFIPDLIISDVMMPERDGIDLCSILKKEHATSHIPIILLSAKDTVEGISIGYQQGADDYITKPFHPQLLIIRIKNLLKSRLELQRYFLNKNSSASTSLTQKQNQLLEREQRFLSKLNEVIKIHINSEDDNANVVALAMGMSRISLYRKLKAITGLSINQYMRNFKIELAANLIKNEGITISQASYEVGFSNVKYFRKIFKEKYGKNPSEFKV